MPAHTRTVCLEFFGQWRKPPAIVEITDYFKPGGAGRPACSWPAWSTWTALCAAVGYATKAKRNGRPKMVLIGDIVGDDENAVAEAASQVVRIANARGGEGFIAVSAGSAQEVLARPLAHRRHLAPHQRLQDQRRRGDPAAAHGRLHRRHRAHQHRAVDTNKLRLLDALTEFFQGDLPLDTEGDAVSADEMIGERRSSALELMATLRQRWQWLLDNLDAPLAQYRSLWPDAPLVDANASPSSVFTAMRDFQLRVSWKDELLNDLENLFSGKADAPILEPCKRCTSRCCAAACSWRCTCTPATATCTPTSRSTPTTTTCCKPRTRRWPHHALARSLNGVISGEHGIGITKLEFLTEDEIAPFRAYKQRWTQGRFNRGKLLPGADLTMAYTPSFSLMGAESLIMEQSDIGAISNSVKDCLRCGKCKPVCSTHVPRANLLYSPRNKILGVAADRGLPVRRADPPRRRLKHWDEFRRGRPLHGVPPCVKPCPVKIDFGDVSVAMRNLLRKTGNKRFNPGTALGMAFLTVKDPATIKAIRGGMVGFGYKAQRLGYSVGKKLHLIGGQTSSRRPPSARPRSRNR
jgi:hypothetical protein